eukprot:scaffold3991_cov159-Ochromonas_danica.AAC.4
MGEKPYDSSVNTGSKCDENKSSLVMAKHHASEPQAALFDERKENDFLDSFEPMERMKEDSEGRNGLQSGVEQKDANILMTTEKTRKDEAETLAHVDQGNNIGDVKEGSVDGDAFDINIHSNLLESTPFFSTLSSERSDDPRGQTLSVAVPSSPVAVPSVTTPADRISVSSVVSGWTGETMSSFSNWLFQLEKVGPRPTISTTSAQAYSADFVHPEESMNALPVTVETVRVLASPIETKSNAGYRDSSSNEAPKNAIDLDFPENSNMAGQLHLSIASAFLYDVEDAGEGDYYLQVHAERQSYTSHIIYNSATPIFNVSYHISLPHYRSRVKVCLMDALSDVVVGQVELWPYMIMQRLADERIEHFHFNYQSRASAPVELRRLKLKNPSTEKEVGHLSATISFEENFQNLFRSINPLAVQRSPPEELSLERLNIHIARFTAIVEIFKDIYRNYMYIMSWEDPLFTLILFIIFLYCTIHIQADYQLSGVIFGIVLFMTIAFYRRKHGLYREHCIARGAPKEPIRRYQPISYLRISVLGFRHGHSITMIRRPMLRISYLTSANADPNTNNGRSSEEASQDKKIEHFIGFLGSQGAGWVATDGLVKSGGLFISSFLRHESKRADHFLHNVIDLWPVPQQARGAYEKIMAAAREEGGFLPAPQQEACLLYPILQPLRPSISLIDSHPDAESNNTTSNSNVVVSETSDLHTDSPSHLDHDGIDLKIFLPWEQHDGLLKVAVAQDPTSTLLEGEKEYVVIPIRSLAQRAFYYPEVENSDSSETGGHYEAVQWMRCANNIKTALEQSHSIFCDEDRSSSGRRNSRPNLSSPHRSANDQESGPQKKQTELLLRVGLYPANPRTCYVPTDDEKRSSTILQEALSEQAEETSSTFSVLWNIRDYVKYVQNWMSWILDMIESYKNLFVWTLPKKTYPIYVLLVIIWILTVFIPGRYLILSWGLYQFLYILLPIPEGDEYIICWDNYLQSIPNDDDLHQVYAQERKSFTEESSRLKKEKLRSTLLGISLPLLWSGSVEVKLSSDHTAASAGTQGWRAVYLLLQGKRFLWFHSIDEMEAGKFPMGQVILTRIANVTQVSPVDLREVCCNCTD